MINRTFLLLAFALLNTYAFAQEWTDSVDLEVPAIQNVYFPMDRPSQTLNARTITKNGWILQMGSDWGGLVSDGFSQSYHIIAFPFDLRYGITDKLEAMISPSSTFGVVNGGGGGIEYSIGSFGAGLRYSIFKDQKFGSLGVFGGYQLLNYERGIETGAAVSIKALYTVPLGRMLIFSTNLGYRNTDFASNQFTYTLNASFPFSAYFGFYIEAFGSVPLGSSEENITSSWGDLGLYWLVSERVQLDIAYSQGTVETISESGSRDFYTSFGASFLLGRTK